MTGTLFFAPSVDFLDDPPPLPTDAAEAPTAEPQSTRTAAERPADGSLGIGSLKGAHPMNNLLPGTRSDLRRRVGSIEEEATRTFKRHIAGRRVVDVRAARHRLLGGRHRPRTVIEPPAEGVAARLREAAAAGRVARAVHAVDREQIDDVDRGAQDSDWQPVKDAAKKIAFAEDRAIFEGYAAGGYRPVSGGVLQRPDRAAADAQGTRTRSPRR